MWNYRHVCMAPTHTPIIAGQRARVAGRIHSAVPHLCTAGTGSHDDNTRTVHGPCLGMTPVSLSAGCGGRVALSSMRTCAGNVARGICMRTAVVFGHTSPRGLMMLDGSWEKLQVDDAMMLDFPGDKFDFALNSSISVSIRTRSLATLVRTLLPAPCCRFQQLQASCFRFPGRRAFLPTLCWRG